MANWLNKIDMSDKWDYSYSRPREGVTLQDFLNTLANRVEALKHPRYDEYLIEEQEECVEALRCIASSEDITEGEFDEAMEDAYDWCDTSVGAMIGGMQDKACWISMG